MKKQKLILIMLIFFQKFMLSSRNVNSHNVVISPYLQPNHQIIDENQIEMIEVKKQLQKNLMIEVKKQLYKNLSPWNDTNNDALFPSSHLMANKARNIHINNEREEKIEIIEVEKKIQEIEIPDCLFCASGYEHDRPYSIEVKGTNAEKHAHKPHEDFWHYGCILQYVEYGHTKCPYCTYELCLNNPRFAINPFIPATQIFPENNIYRQSQAERRVPFADVNRFISMRPQNRRSRFSMAVFCNKCEECVANFNYGLSECWETTIDFLLELFDKILIFFSILFKIIFCVPFSIGYVIAWIIDSSDMDCDCEECAKCLCAWICIFFIVLIIYTLVAIAFQDNLGE